MCKNAPKGARLITKAKKSKEDEGNRNGKRRRRLPERQKTESGENRRKTLGTTVCLGREQRALNQCSAEW